MIFVVADLRTGFLERCSRIDGATVSEGAFVGGPAVWVGKREIAHFEGDDTLDIRLTRACIRARRPDLSADDRVTLRARASDWLEYRMTSEHDADVAFALVEAAVEANLGSAPAGPPPAGEDLERRRRFH